MIVAPYLFGRVESAFAEGAFSFFVRWHLHNDEEEEEESTYSRGRKGRVGGHLHTESVSVLKAGRRRRRNNISIHSS